MREASSNLFRWSAGLLLLMLGVAAPWAFAQEAATVGFGTAEIMFQPAANGGLCSNMRSRCNNSPPRRARIAATSAAGSAISAAT